jgi:hypothetical protein
VVYSSDVILPSIEPTRLKRAAKGYAILPFWDHIKSIFGRIFRALRRTFDGLSTWFFAVVAMLLVPCIPVLIDFLKNGVVSKDIYLVTSAVLAAGYFFAAEHNLLRGIYFLLFLITIILDTLTLNGDVAATVDKYAGLLLLAVAIAHSSERFWWHVVLERPFPDI